MPDWRPEIKERLAGLKLEAERETAIVEELAQYLDDHYAELLAAGATSAEADRRTLEELGESEIFKRELRRVERQVAPEPVVLGTNRRTNMLADLWQDLRYGARMLGKKPGFTLVAVVTLALGIGANTAIFSLVDALLLEPLPYREPERLVMLSEIGRQGGRSQISYPNFSDWRERARSFAAMASVRSESFNLTGVDRPMQLGGRTVDWNFFALLGVEPQLGRLFFPEEDRYGAARTVLLSDGLWRSKFGGDASIIGRRITLNGEPHEVIGVLPPGFEYFRADDLYVPIGLFLKPQTSFLDRGSSMGLYALGRLKPGVTLEQANSEMKSIAAQLAREYPAFNSGRNAQAERLQDVMSESVRESLWVLFAAVGFILLIACANVASLLVVRAAERRREIALRLALGARGGRIVRQLLAESLLLASSGGAIGVVIGSWMLDALLALAPGNIPQLGRVSLNADVLLFALGVSALTSLLCGLLPALQAARTDLQAALKIGARAHSTRALTRKTLLVVEISLAIVLLIGAGLLLRSMSRVLGVDPGFDPDNLLTMRVSLPPGAYSAERTRAFYEECLERLNALPGVRAAGITISLPIDGSYWNSWFTAADKPVPPRSELPNAAMIPVSANYFETAGLRLLKGRAFTSVDTASSPRVAIINESLARRIWPGEDPIGKRIKQGYPENPGPWREVVGVVADVKLNGVERETPMQAYLPFPQEPWSSFSILARTTGDPLESAPAVESAIHTIDKDLPVFSIRSMDQLLGSSRSQRRLMLVLLSSFAALALLLAAVGIYGVISYAVRRRTPELGIRLALGAQRKDLLALVVGEGMRLAIAGAGIGLIGAYALTRLMASMLFEVSATDPLTFIVVAIGLIGVAMAACYIPARRATRVDPMTALRCE